MATTPLFIGAAFTTGDPVAITAAITSVTDGTGATTVVTGVPSIVTGITFCATGVTPRTLLLIYHYDGTDRNLIGYVQVDERGFSMDEPPWTATWYNPSSGPLASGDRFDVGFFGATATVHARALGGDL